MTDARPISVLNVNDEAACRYTMTRMLLRAGFDVTEAATGAECLELIAKNPDVVVLDVKLPDMSGFEVCQRIKSNLDTSSVPVLLTSAKFVSTAKRVQGLEWGADGYLVQPAEAIELIAIIRALVRARRAEDERNDLLTRERTARRGAERLNRLKDEFLATISHELRTPLTAILGWSRLIMAQEIEPDRMQKGLATIERNARAQAQLVEDMLDVSAIITGKLRVNPRPTSIRAVIEAAMETVRPAAEARGVTLSAELEAGVGAMVGDEDRLQQVFWNLLSNGVKFTPAGGRVEVRAARVGSELVVTVSDTGKGIHADFLPFVFDRFRQADSSASRLQGGLGLGLAIARHLVEMHGGSIEAESEGEDRGATFTIHLPLGAAELASDPRAQPEPFSTPETHAENSQGSLRGLKVLVVDDDADTRDLIQMILGHAGAKVTLAGSVRGAMLVLREQAPNVLVSDIGLPGEDGYALMQKVRSLGADNPASGVPAVAVTAYARSEDRRRALASGFQMHVPKPIEPNQLVSVIARLTGRESSGN
jgi:signal transduction histidine kinase